MKFRPILTDSTLQELTEHGSEDFPMSMDEQLVSAKAAPIAFHWHYEIQVVLATKGTILFKTPDREFLIDAGQGIFFNSGCLHEALPTEAGDSVYICVNFHPKIIYGYADSLLKHAYVDPILFSNAIQVMPLQNRPWQREVCTILKKLANIYTARPFGHEVEMYSLILHMWYLIVHNNEKLLIHSAPATTSDRQRIKTLTHFISKNYMEAISLADIAGSDHISKGECCRLFKRVMNITPFSYLMKYRISKSVKMLTMTDLSISEIAQSAGFGSSSYFTECFKKEIRCTPTKYRKRLVKKES